MSLLLRGLFAELCVVLAGFGVALSLQSISRRPVQRIELAGLSLLLGQAVISLVLFAAGGVWSDTMLIGAVALFSGVLGALGFVLCRRLVFAHGRDGWFWLLLVALLAAIGWQTGIRSLSADGLFNFEIRAQLAALNGGHIPTSFFSDPSRVWAHPRYPLFLPLNQTWLYLCLGTPHQGLGQLLAVHLAASAFCLLYAGVGRLTSESWRGILAVVLLSLLPAAMLVPGGATSLWADFPLAVFFLGAVIYLVEFARFGRSLPQFAVFLALLPWVKREGIVLAAVLVVALGWITVRRRSIHLLPPALLPLVTLAGGWAIFLHAVQASADRDFLPVSMETAAQHAERLPLILIALGRELVAVQRWNLLWPLTALAAIRVWRDNALACWRILPPVIVALCALYSAIYLFSAWPSLALHLVTSLPRLLLPVAMPALLLVAAAAPLRKRPVPTQGAASMAP